MDPDDNPSDCHKRWLVEMRDPIGFSPRCDGRTGRASGRSRVNPAPGFVYRVGSRSGFDCPHDVRPPCGFPC
jgi:hypothetical protein